MATVFGVADLKYLICSFLMSLKTPARNVKHSTRRLIATTVMIRQARNQPRDSLRVFSPMKSVSAICV